MNIKELELLLQTKKTEFETAQKEVNKAKCSKQLSIFSEIISTNDELVSLIISQNLTADDCKILASKLLNDISSIYEKYEADIRKNQQRRFKKNKARNASRSASVHEHSNDNENVHDVNMARSY